MVGGVLKRHHGSPLSNHLRSGSRNMMGMNLVLIQSVDSFPLIIRKSYQFVSMGAPIYNVFGPISVYQSIVVNYPD